MAYTPTTWTDGVTPASAANMNNIEAGVDTQDDRIVVLEGRPVTPTVVNGQWIKGVGGVPTWAAITESDVTNLVTDLAAKQATSQKGAANGYASLDSGGLVPSAQLPTATLPARLGATPVAVTDWNSATDNGWYYSDASTASNAPISSQTWIGMVVRHPSTGYLTQTLWTIYPGGGSPRQYTRVQSASAWGAWVPGAARCSARGSGSQSMAGGAAQIVAFATADWDSDGIRSTTSRMTVPTGLGGIWQIGATLAFGSGGSTPNAWTGLYLLKNGSGNLGQDVAGFNGQAVGPTAQATVSVTDLGAAGDFYEVLATSGIAGSYVGSFTATRLSA
jgi:hypothetical protein